MSNIYIHAIFVVLWVGGTNGKIYSRCEFAKALLVNGISKDQVADYVCIAQHESGLNTQSVNSDTGDYGILQISHLFWCNDGDTSGKECHITCKSLLSDDVTGDIKCAKTIFTETKNLGGCGFCAWVTYKQYCSGGRSANYINGCNI